MNLYFDDSERLNADVPNMARPDPRTERLISNMCDMALRDEVVFVQQADGWCNLDLPMPSAEHTRRSHYDPKLVGLHTDSSGLEHTYVGLEQIAEHNKRQTTRQAASLEIAYTRLVDWLPERFLVIDPSRSDEIDPHAHILGMRLDMIDRITSIARGAVEDKHRCTLDSFSLPPNAKTQFVNFAQYALKSLA